MAARLDGRLVVANGCVYIAGVGSRYLVVWPSKYQILAVGGLVRIVDEAGNILASQGGPVSVGGGEVAITADDARAALLELTGTAIPDECGTLVWNASSILAPE